MTHRPDDRFFDIVHADPPPIELVRRFIGRVTTVDNSLHGIAAIGEKIIKVSCADKNSSAGRLARLLDRWLELARCGDPSDGGSGHLWRANWEERRDMPIALEISARLPLAYFSLATFAKLVLASRNPKINVHLRGSSGTGKRLAAEAIHQLSRIFSNCQGVFEQTVISRDSDLVEAQIFGIEKGVATDVSARPGALKKTGGFGSTLFLDEIHALPGPVQEMLKLTFQHGDDRTFKTLGSSVDSSFNGRLITASNKNIEDSEGRVHADLAARLCQLTIHLPTVAELCSPMKDPHLVFLEVLNFHLRQLTGVTGQEIGRYSDEEWKDVLLEDSLAGNWRSVENAVRRDFYAAYTDGYPNLRIRRTRQNVTSNVEPRSEFDVIAKALKSVASTLRQSGFQVGGGGVRGLCRQMVAFSLSKASKNARRSALEAMSSLLGDTPAAARSIRELVRDGSATDNDEDDRASDDIEEPAA